MIQPIRDNVLVKPYPSNEISEGGLLIPESAREVNNKVKVVAVGNGVAGKPMKLKVGDSGYRVKAWGQEILVDGELHFLMSQDAILALQ